MTTERLVENEVFALRDGEVSELWDTPPVHKQRWFAVQLVNVQMPEGDYQKHRQTDGAPVEMTAVVACQINTEGLWQWMYLSPATKEQIGDLLVNNRVDRDRWYYISVTG
jgi:hypothetical protein